jgi:hypothetical protein
VRRSVIAFALLTAFAAQARASIPVDDAAQLTQRSVTASTTVKLVPVTTQRKDANKGIKCAVTTGKKANVTDPTVTPQDGAGSQKIHAYAPDLPATSDPAAQGAALSSQTLFKSGGDVVAGGDASRSTLSAAQSGFKAAGKQVGTATTVMAAIDMNSAARLQNDLAWNGVTGSTNLWVTALNALNLAAASDTSRAAGAMQTITDAASPPAGLACPAGTTGAGSASDPCRSPASCSTTPPGTPPDPACVSARYVDTNGNVLFYLARTQDAAATAPAADAALTAADVADALAAINANSR